MRRRKRSEGMEMLNHLTVDEIDAIVAQAEDLDRRISTAEHGIAPEDKHAFGPHLLDRRRLERAIAALGFEARMELVALARVGRGFEDGFDDALAVAKAETTAADVGYISDDAAAFARAVRLGLSRLGL